MRRLTFYELWIIPAGGPLYVDREELESLVGPAAAGRLRVIRRYEPRTVRRRDQLRDRAKTPRQLPDPKTGVLIPPNDPARRVDGERVAETFHRAPNRAHRRAVAAMGRHR